MHPSVLNMAALPPLLVGAVKRWASDASEAVFDCEALGVLLGSNPRRPHEWGPTSGNSGILLGRGVAGSSGSSGQPECIGRGSQPHELETQPGGPIPWDWGLTPLELWLGGRGRELPPQTPCDIRDDPASRTSRLSGRCPQIPRENSQGGASRAGWAEACGVF